MCQYAQYIINMINTSTNIKYNLDTIQLFLGLVIF